MKIMKERGGGRIQCLLQQTKLRDYFSLFLGRHCQPEKKYVFIKVEKTGSSTLTSIFARHIRKHRQNVMTMTRGGHLDITKKRGQRPGKIH